MGCGGSSAKGNDQDQTISKANKPSKAKSKDILGKSKRLEMWVEKVLDFSSEFEYETDDGSHVANNIIGGPRVYPEYTEDKHGSWCTSGFCKPGEHIKVQFREAVYIDYVDIYEVFYCGAITNIDAIDEKGKSHSLYKGQPKLHETARIFRVHASDQDYKSKQIKITVNQKPLGYWTCIDCVKLTGWKTKNTTAHDEYDHHKLSEDMADLLYSSRYSDVSFIVDNKEIKAHRGILSQRSEFFRKLFEENPVAEITIEDFPYDSFFMVLQYMYANRVLSDYGALEFTQTIRAAVVHKMPEVEKLARRELVNKLNDENALVVHKEAVEKTPKLPKVEELCETYLKDNAKAIIGSDAFKSGTVDPKLMVKITQWAF